MSLYYNFLYMHNLHFFSGREIGDQSLTNHLVNTEDEIFELRFADLCIMQYSMYTKRH